MHFIVMDTKDGSRASYASDLSASLTKAFPDTDTIALTGAISSISAKPAILSESELPTPTAEQASQVAKLKAEAQDYIAATAPLLAGETVEEERYSILGAPFGSYAKGTAVLLRRTSRAETCYFFPGVTIVPGGIRIMPPGRDDETDPEAQPLGAVPAILIDAAKALAQMLGSAILDELFPEKMPPYFVQVFEQIRKIVKDELTRQTIDELSGQFEGVVRFVKNEYEPEKKKSGVSKELLGRLQHQSDEMYKMVATLMPDRYAMSGLAVFQYGATAHLSMLQEIAIQRNKLGIVGEAPSAGTFADYAKQSEETWPKVSKARNKGEILKWHHCSPSGGGDVACTEYWYWKDSISGKKDGRYSWGCGSDYKDPPAAHAAAKKALDKHLAAEVAALKASLNDPPNLAKQWREAGKKLPG